MDERQLVKLAEVLQAGNKPEITFIEQTRLQKKLREIQSRETNQILGAILQQASVLAGIKEGIQDIVKQDLKDLIFGRFQNLSLEEIAYAFKLERQRVYETKTEHYQFFSTDYVAEILSKYKEYKRQTMFEKNISFRPPEKALPEKVLSFEERKEKFLENIQKSVERYKLSGEMPLAPAPAYYDGLFEFGFLKVEDFSEEIKQDIRQRATIRYQQDLKQEQEYQERKFPFKKVLKGLRKVSEENQEEFQKQNQEIQNAIQSRCKDIVVEEFIKQLAVGK